MQVNVNTSSNTDQTPAASSTPTQHPANIPSATPHFSGTGTPQVAGSVFSNDTNATNPAAKFHTLDYVIAYRESCELAYKSPEFLEDRKRVEKATESNRIPSARARVEAQLKVTVRKKLADEAHSNYLKTGTYVPPTQEEIDEGVAVGLKKWEAKQR